MSVLLNKHSYKIRTIRSRFNELRSNPNALTRQTSERMNTTLLNFQAYTLQLLFFKPSVKKV